MAFEFKFIVGKDEFLREWSSQCTQEEWVDMYENLSKSYGSWQLDLELAEYIVKKVKKGYIDKYKDEDIPDILRPLLLESIKNDFESRNKENGNLTLEDVSGKSELKAIEVCRNINVLDYNTAINLFCDGFDYALQNNDKSIDLSGVSSECLLKELKNRI